MGTTVRLSARGCAPAALEHARAIVEDCESRWSRFRDDSEVSRINERAGEWAAVSPDTYRLVEASMRACAITGGRFDPTVLRALVAAGYDRSFELVTAETTIDHGDTGAVIIPLRAPAAWVPGCGAIDLNERTCSVRLVEGTAIDLGGIAKGHTADLVVQSLLEAGATAALANLGGDIRVGGEPPRSDGWCIGADHPLTGDPLPNLFLAEGAVATSTSTRRRWTVGGDTRHHLIDPLTAAPADSGLVSVTIVAATAMWAEVLAKAAFVAGRDEGAALIEHLGATGFLVTDSGEIVELCGLEAFVR